MTRPTELELDKLERHADLARDWLMWPSRQREMNPQLPASRIFADGLFPFDNFLDYVCERNRDRYRDDAQARIEAFTGAVAAAVRRGCSALPLLHILALRGERITIAFEGDRPVLRGDPNAYNPGPNRRRHHRKGSVSRWQHYASEFDPDAISTLEYARYLDAIGADDPEEADLESWPLHMRFADGDLDRLIAQGISDQHLHMKSLSSVALSWQRTLADERRLDLASVFKPREIGADRRRNAEQQADYEFIRTAIQEARAKFREAGREHADGLLGAVAAPGNERFFERKDRDDGTFSGTSELHARSPRNILAPYRHALVRIWRVLLGAPSKQRDAWEASLDLYLGAKMRFRYHHLQHTYDTNPGLSTFDLFRKRNSHLGRFHDEEASGTSFNLKRFALNNGLLVSTLVDDENIRRADLRIAPQTVVPNALARTYARHGFGLAQLYHPYADQADLGTSIHFKRHLIRRKADKRYELPHSGPLLRKIEEYDRETAGLQLMRSRLTETADDTRLRAALDVYRRIDLASLERGSGPERIAPFVRLLRGDVETLEALEKLPEETPYALRWKRLSRYNRARPPADAPTLDLTVHAGEDFDTLVQGLFHIERAIDTWRMRPGDSLGHALALGACHLEEDRYHDALEHKQIALGNDLDQLAWLLDIVDRELPGNTWIGQRLRDALRQIALRLYAPYDKNFDFNPVDVDLLKEKVRRADRFLPLPPEFGPLRLSELGNSCHLLEKIRTRDIRDLPYLKPADVLRVADLFVPDIANARAESKAPNPVHQQLRKPLQELQTWVTELVVARGLTIETNPSSNFRMGRHTDARELPLVPLMKRTDGPRITVCTDNPGTYDVSVSSEYAMLFEALRAGEDGLSREDALARLDDMRRIGLTRIAWRKPATRRSGRRRTDGET